MSRSSLGRLARIGLVLLAVSACSDGPLAPTTGPRQLVAHPDVSALASSITIDATAGVNPTSGVAVVSGTLSCASPASVTLNVKLSQSQKLRRVPAVVEASDVMTIDCTGTHVWSIALTAASGGFQAGTGTASVATDGSVGLPTQTSASVKLYWARK